MWKMLHLLHIYGPSLTRSQVRKVGITCDPDTIDPLVDSGAVEAYPPNRLREEVKEYRLTNAARSLLQSCLGASRGSVYVDVRADEPSVFYELGLSHALGREVILLKQLGAPLPADLAGAHYYEYGTGALNAGRKVLAKALKGWAKQNRAAQVEALKK